MSPLEQRWLQVAISAFACTVALVFSACGSGSGQSSPEGQRAPSATGEPSGEKSIEEFGSEAAGADRTAVLAGFDGYLTALAAKRYGAACRFLSRSVIDSLTELSGAGSHHPCGPLLDRLLSPTAPALARAEAGGAVTKVRVERDQGFVLYRAPGAALYEMPMVNEPGGWKAGLLTGSVLIPSPRMLGR